MKKFILFLAISFFISCSTDNNKVTPEKYVFTLNNTSENLLQILTFSNGNLIQIDSLNPLQTKVDSFLYSNPNSNQFFPLYLDSDSTFIIFDNLKIIKYFSINSSEYTLINNKNLTSLSTWITQDLSNEKIKYFKCEFQITEEDYALAEDL